MTQQQSLAASTTWLCAVWRDNVASASGLVVGPQVGVTKDLANQEARSGIDVDIELGRGIKPSDKAMLFAELIQTSLVDLGRLDIALVCQQNDRERLTIRQCNLVVNLTLPFGDSLKGRWSRKIVHQHGAVSILVVHACDGSEAVLTRNIPQLQSHCRVVHGQLLQGKIHADSRLVMAAEKIVNVSLNNTGLSSGWITKNQHLQYAILCSICHYLS
mmetsp:Transcript_21130/g.42111  ORF Transcript_21130/g.42111 Transcript_21130/m.42111 type:complete len:216 (+) Transcript_21130:143-790(+)